MLAVSLFEISFASANSPAPLAPTVDIGVYKNVPPPIHVPLKLDFFAPRDLRRMHNVYQFDQRYAEMFDPATKISNICGAAAMANNVIYMKHYRTPALSRLLQSSIPTVPTVEDYVRRFFVTCETDRVSGTKLSKLHECAKSALQEGDYPAENATRLGIHDARELAPGVKLDHLHRAFEKNSGVVMLFGWYVWKMDAQQKDGFYVRDGGHFVTLAGRHDLRRDVFYISNPLVDYDAINAYPASQIVLSGLELKLESKTLAVLKTDDLAQGRLAILEDLVTIEGM